MSEAKSLLYRKSSTTELASKLMKRENKVAVLLGAGVSHSAGIPTATKIMEYIAKEFKPIISKLKKHNYAEYMDILTPAERNRLLSGYIKDAKINSAYLYLGQLVADGYIDRILTTNFDPLVVNGLVYANTRPFVYDLANLKHFTPGQIASPAVIYLHGQFGGFINLHSEEETEVVRPLIEKVLDDTIGQRSLIVVGYGGENDPVFNELCKNTSFPYGLYWVYHRNEGPKEHVRDKLLSDKKKFAYYINNINADDFFMEIVNGVGGKPPPIIHQPFTFLKEAVAGIKEIKEEFDDEENPRQWIEEAIKCREQGKFCRKSAINGKDFIDNAILKQISEVWSKQRFKKIEELFEIAKEYGAQKAICSFRDKFLARGKKFVKNAQTLKLEKSESLFQKAFSDYEKAVEIDPYYSESYYLWGIAFLDFSKQQEDQGAKISLKEAIKKFKRATKINPKNENYLEYWHEGAIEQVGDKLPPIRKDIYFAIILSWGDALYELSKHLKGKESKDLLKEAFKKYQLAGEINNDEHEVFKKQCKITIKLAKVGPEKDRIRTLKKAREIAISGEKITPNHFIYEQTQIAALMDEKEKAFQLLEKTLSKAIIEISVIEKDENLSNLHSDPRWKKLIDKYRITEIS